MDDDGRGERMRPAFPFEVERVSAFDDAPAVIVSAPDDLDHFPLVLSDVAAPEITGRIEVNPPRVAKAVRPQFGARIRQAQKGIVFRTRITFAGRRALDIDAQHSGHEIADLLAGEVGIRIARAV